MPDAFRYNVSQRKNMGALRPDRFNRVDELDSLHDIVPVLKEVVRREHRMAMRSPIVQEHA